MNPLADAEEIFDISQPLLLYGMSSYIFALCLAKQWLIHYGVSPGDSFASNAQNFESYKKNKKIKVELVPISSIIFSNYVYFVKALG